MVLNNEGIKRALADGSLIVSKYTWRDTLEKANLDIGELRGSHKIRLHVGFLLRTLSDKRWVNPKSLYNKRDGIIDLRQLEGHKYLLHPGESVLLYTNEAVTLGPGYFGLLLSRVSLEETGLIASQSYIDPNWEGVLQIVVTNNSETPRLLQEHCEIANLVLFKMEQEADETIQKKNDHYGVTWETISDNPDFPKWKDRKRTWWVKFKHVIRTYRLWFLGIGGVGILGILYQMVSIIKNVLELLPS